MEPPGTVADPLTSMTALTDLFPEFAIRDEAPLYDETVETLGLDPLEATHP